MRDVVRRRPGLREVSSDDMALIAEASKDLNIAMVVLV